MSGTACKKPDPRIAEDLLDLFTKDGISTVASLSGNIHPALPMDRLVAKEILPHDPK